MTVARRFIAGSRTTWGLRPGGTPEYRRAIKRRECISDGPSPISIAPPGRDQFLNTSTGDKSPAYFLVVPPGHTGIATALNAEMSKLQCAFWAGAIGHAPKSLSVFVERSDLLTLKKS